MSMPNTYTNPVLKGFFPDPSVIRVGDDYYLVNSTFQYFPAIVISHSRDLVHWRQIGHAVTDLSALDLVNLDDSRGIWAPDIAYYDGTFYIVATYRLNATAQQHILMTSDRPEGPYSKPVVVYEGGIDPAFFIDDDGSRYLLFNNAATIIRLNDDCTRAVGKPTQIWTGTGKNSPEGPHVFKKDGYYYVILAEGGTGYGHSITAARSKNLFGPYKACPHNPILTQTDPKARIQRAGHGKFVETQNGEWWVMYLCSRPLPGRYCSLGRETALDPVTWTDDGWPLINDGQGPSETQRVPNLPPDPYEMPGFDDFDEPELGKYWQFVRNPNPSFYSLTERPGYFRIWTLRYDLTTIHARDTLVRREQHHCYTASLKLEFAPDANGQQAGLVCYYDTIHHIRLCLIYDDGLKIRLIQTKLGEMTTLGEVQDVAQSVVYLKVAVDHEKREFFWSADNHDWHLVGTVADARFLSDEAGGEYSTTQEGVPRMCRHKAFTGTMVGMYANNGETGAILSADFDWFRYQEDE
jgi:xylan 1,4-beta-xylosidase